MFTMTRPTADAVADRFDGDRFDAPAARQGAAVAGPPAGRFATLSADEVTATWRAARAGADRPTADRRSAPAVLSPAAPPVEDEWEECERWDGLA